jgi:hypothetical protein
MHRTGWVPDPILPRSGSLMSSGSPTAHLVRMGFMAGEIARHGGTCGAIGRYRATRINVRNMVGSDNFILGS